MARREARGRSLEVDLVRRPHVESGVRAITVVPGDEAEQLASESVALVGNQDSTRAFVFHRSDEPLDDCDAPELANGTESLLGASVSTPPMKPGVGEMCSPILQSTWAILTLPMDGQRTLSRRTM